MNQKLYRSKDRKLAGVCGGLGAYLGIDPTLVRVLYVLVSIFTSGFPGLLVYLILALVIPEQPEVQ